MSRIIDDRLSRLRDRRSDGLTTFSEGVTAGEIYERRTSDKATRYALGAMQEVSPRSTRISIEEGEKVENCLRDGLNAVGIYPTFRLQGSVPLNVHIKGVSDVDLLLIEQEYLKVDVCGVKSNTYLPYTRVNSIEVELLDMRTRAAKILNSQYHVATVDNTGAKSISLSGGGFRRKVDVVPSYWFDSANYQATGDEASRGIMVVDRNTQESIQNFPFIYMTEIKSKATATNDGARMAIRLAKNVKNDSDTDIALSSYDIGSIFYHCPSQQIFHYLARDLLVLAGAESWIAHLSANRPYAESLKTPDGTRKIIDSTDKWIGLQRLSAEMTSLAEEVDREIRSPYVINSSKDELRKRLMDRSIPTFSPLQGGLY